MISTIPILYLLASELVLPRRRTGEPELVHLSPREAARALGIPVSVLTHAHTSGQVPAGVTTVQWGGLAFVVRYVLSELAAWAATAPVIDTTLPTMPAFTAGFGRAVPEAAP